MKQWSSKELNQATLPAETAKVFLPKQVNQPKVFTRNTTLVSNRGRNTFYRANSLIKFTKYIIIDRRERDVSGIFGGAAFLVFPSHYGLSATPPETPETQFQTR